jgi:hypothetical protein
MAALVAAIHVYLVKQGVHARRKAGHDGVERFRNRVTRGLDPRVHYLRKLSWLMDRRVKPGDDGWRVRGTIKFLFSLSTGRTVVGRKRCAMISSER